MLQTSDVEKLIIDVARKADQERAANHTPSGKLSASMLGMPLQWQVLKALAVIKDEPDDYTLLKFKRGRDVEDFIVDSLEQSGLKIEKQVECNYRNVIGYLDILAVDEGQSIEVKSVTNAAFKWIKKSNQAKRHHILQGCHYALSQGKADFGILYVASDDYRVQLFNFKTSEYEREVNTIIDKFDRCIKERRIPKFEPIEKWHDDDKYNNFLDWKNKSEHELQKLAIQAYKNRKEA